MPKTRSKKQAEPNTPTVDTSDDEADAVDREEEDSNASAVRVKQETEEDEEEPRPNPNDQALEILSDLVEYEAEMMFWDREQRVQHWKSLEFFWKTHPASNYKFGGLFTRRQLALLLLAACSERPYSDAPDKDDDEYDDEINMMPMKMWNRGMWEELEKDLTEGREHCLRKDSAHTWNLNLTEEEVLKFQKPDKNKKRSKLDLFNKKYNVVMKLCEIQKVLAPIRQRLEAALEEGQKGKIKISQRELNEIVDYAKETEHQGVEEIIGLLFDEDETLKTVEELEPILTDKPFDLEKLQYKLEFMLQKWSREVFRADPELVKLKYRVDKSSATMKVLKLPPSARLSLSPSKSGTGSAARSQTKSGSKKSRRSASQAELDELRRGRAALDGRHGPDPLESSVKAAQEVAGAAKRHRDDEDDESDSGGEDEDHRKKRARGEALYEKKKSAKRMIFMDDIEADDEEEEKERVELSATPRRKSNPFPKSYEGIMPEEGVFDEAGNVTKRRTWLPEEKDAIKAAVEKIGWNTTNRWVKVKQMYPEILRNRTGVQLKDCWRTMVKNGEVEQPAEDATHCI